MELRETFAYNNWDFEIADHVIKEVAGEAWDSLLEKHILKPLDLKHTYANGWLGSLNDITKAYPVPDNGDPWCVPKTPQSGQTLMGAAWG